jgi:hypothetical protein
MALLCVAESADTKVAEAPPVEIIDAKGWRCHEFMGPWSPVSRHVFHIAERDTLWPPPKPSLN